MRLTAAQYEERYHMRRLALTLIGMSNIGKSYWANALATIGFRRLSSDDMLRAKLRAAGVCAARDDEGLAAWLGMPFTEGFPERERQLLTFERATLERIAAGLAAEPRGNAIVDPAGSFVYAGTEISDALRAHSLVVYLEATPTMRREMFERFSQHPKALVWSGMFDRRSGESEPAALARCYERLLTDRAERYARCADITIPCDALPENGNGAQCLAALRECLMV